MTPHADSFRERLTAPWWSWVLAFFWALTLAIAYGSAITTPVGVMVGVASFGLASLGLARVATVVTVSGGGLTAGRARLPWAAIGEVNVLDATEARRRRGTDADSRAFLLLRGWVPTAVTVAVVDPLDPTPYWYVSSRAPERLASALLRAGETPSTNAPVADVTGLASSPSLEEGT